MPEDMSPAGTPENVPSQSSPRKPRSPVERAVVWTAIGALAIVMVLQWRAQQGFSKSESAIRLALRTVEESSGEDQKTVTVQDIPAMIHGSPSHLSEPIDIPFHSERRVDTYTWRGVLKPYVLRLYFGVEAKEGFGKDRKILPADLVRYETN